MKKVFIKIMYRVKKVILALTPNYWVCMNCGKIDFKEQEVSCWHCPVGEMIYKGDF